MTVRGVGFIRPAGGDVTPPLLVLHYYEILRVLLQNNTLPLMKNKLSSLLTALLIIPFFAATAVFAMPPHPVLLEKIRKGEIAEPDFFKNVGQLRQKGIDAPWTAPELILRRLSAAPAVITRSFGPLLAPSGSWNALLILVDFSDNDSQVAASFFDDLIFGTGTATLRDYYRDVSYNNLDIVTVNLPGTVGWNRAPQTYAYYVNGENGFGSYPNNAQKMVEDVVALVDPVVDFSLYDNDGDDSVDALFIVHAGSGAEFTGNPNDIWSHAWSTSIPQLLDGVYVYNYSTEPEYWLTPGDMTMGVYAHELGHAAFGLPDLYDYGYDSEGLGVWSLMAGGSWNGSFFPFPYSAYTSGDSPSFPDAWSHFQMGYVAPVNITSNITGQTIENIETDSEVYRLWSNGAGGQEYFLVENRQQIGYDFYLPGSGLLIYHIDESMRDVTNNDSQWYPGYTSSGHYLVALEQADGLWELERYFSFGDDGDPYPGSTNNRNLTFLTLPDSKDYNGNNTYVKVENISNSGNTMSADLNVLFHTVTSSVGAHGIISPEGAITVADGDTPAFVIAPDTRYLLATLLIDGSNEDTQNGLRTGYIFEPVIADHTIEATFASIPTHTITASAGLHGIIIPSGYVTVDEGDMPTFTITPDSGYHLASLLLDGTPVDTENGTLVSYIFEPVTEDHTMEATFKANPSSGGGGGGAVGPLAVGLSALLGWWKRRRQRNPRA